MNDRSESIRILLVDDEEEFRAAARKALGRRGFDVTEADGGERAIELIRSSPPDVVLLDLRMEDMDGIDTLEELRSIEPDLPVIILTGLGGFDDAVAGIGLDIVDFVQKPVNMEALAERIRRLIVNGHVCPLRERTVRDLMVPPDSYRWLRADQSLADAVEALRDSLFIEILGRAEEKGHRSALVHDDEGRFVGMVRVEDILHAVLPPFLRGSPHASCFTGMFLARSKVLGGLRVLDLIREPERLATSVDEDASLMEAVHVMVSRHVVCLPVMKGGEVVGVIRDKDLLLEVARSVLGV